MKNPATVFTEAATVFAEAATVFAEAATVFAEAATVIAGECELHLEECEVIRSHFGSQPAVLKLASEIETSKLSLNRNRNLLANLRP